MTSPASRVLARPIDEGVYEGFLLEWSEPHGVENDDWELHCLRGILLYIPCVRPAVFSDCQKDLQSNIMSALRSDARSAPDKK